MTPHPHRVPLDRYPATINSPGKSHRSGVRRMSLVMAFCLSNGDTLLIADKGRVELDQDGNSGGRADDAIKLMTYANGVIGYAGYSSLAIDMIKGLSPLTSEDQVTELQEKLQEQHHRLTAYMPEEDRHARAVEFLFADNGGTVRTYRSRLGFSPELAMDWAGIGRSGLAMLIYYAFYHTIIIHDINAAKRLAVMQVLLTSEACPTEVSPEIDMWMLKRGANKPELIGGISEIRKDVLASKARMIAELYKIPANAQT